MGVGKSTIAKQLAIKLRRPFIDLDQYIELQEGRSILQIFEEEGEGSFRELEFEAIQQLMQRDNAVIALGGGTLSHHDLHRKLRSKGLLVYLEASPEFLSKRLASEIEQRPLLQDKENLLEFIDSHLEEREPAYLNAQIRVNVEEKSSEEITAFIHGYMDMF